MYTVQYSVVILCLSCTVSEIFNVEYRRGLQILVMGHLRSLIMASFDKLDKSQSDFNDLTL